MQYTLAWPDPSRVESIECELWSISQAAASYARVCQPKNPQNHPTCQRTKCVCSQRSLADFQYGQTEKNPFAVQSGSQAVKFQNFKIY